jgi:hypothetical protein
MIVYLCFIVFGINENINAMSDRHEILKHVQGYELSMCNAIKVIRTLFQFLFERLKRD